MCKKYHFYESCAGSFNANCQEIRWIGTQILECAAAKKSGTGILGCPQGLEHQDKGDNRKYQCEDCYELSVYELENGLDEIRR